MKDLNGFKKIHSKSKYLEYNEVKPAKYIVDSRFTTKQKQLLFRLRSKTLDVKHNFKHQHTNLWCISCGLFTETQSHLLQCPALVTNLKFLNVKTSKLNENFIYGNLEQQEMIIKIYSDIIEVRENLQNIINV